MSKPSMGLIDLFKNHSNAIGPWAKKQHKKCEYERSMNTITEPLELK